VAIAVFIENPAGLSIKHHFDERRGILQATSAVSRPYPYPYGFVLNAPAADGDNLDCFVLTPRRLNPGDVVECEVLGLMEQWEDAVVDHNLIARPLGETAQLTETIQASLIDFVSHVFDHLPGKVVRAGRFLDENEAHRHLVALRRR
jgi:inorganic pyrophosphatase